MISRSLYPLALIAAAGPAVAQSVAEKTPAVPTAPAVQAAPEAPAIAA